MTLSAQNNLTRARWLLPVLILCVSVSAEAQAVPSIAAAEQALMEAAFGGNLDEVQRLVSAGIAVNATTPDNQTPLMWSAFNGHTPVVAYLLDKDASIEAKDANSRTALMYASSGPFAETVELLLENGAEVNIQGSLEGFTALMTAAAEGQLEVVRKLLIYGADPALKDKDGDTAESFASQNGHSAVVDLLRNPPPATSAAE